MPREGLSQHNLTTFAVVGGERDEWAMPCGLDAGRPFLFRNFADRPFAEPGDVPVFFQPPTSGTGPTPPGLPVFNWDQAAAQLTRIDLSWSGSPGSPATVTYGFRSTEPLVMPDGMSGFSQFSAAQVAATEAALQLWSDVANITFVRVNQGGYTNDATMLFANYFQAPPEASGFGFYPGSTAASENAGDVWVNLGDEDNSDLTLGTFGPQLLAHEIGHAIGIAHPADYDASDDDPPTYLDDAVYWQDSRAFTVMSYFGSLPVGFALGAFAAGPQLHDIAAAQLLYGANMSTRTGDTVYGFNSNTDRAHYTITADGQTPVFAIWDAGGTDTLDLSGYSTPVEIDLREEAFSSAGPSSQAGVMAHGNIAIARGAVIENGVGGAGDDLIIGNAAVNHLTGNGGADILEGGALNDLLNGGAGVDAAVYSIASTAATWTRNVNGTWTVTAGANGSDSLTGIEFLDFTDRDVFLDRAVSTFSGDGASDLLLRNSATGMLVMWANASAAAGSHVATLSTAWSVVSAGDFNGDGRDDILWRNTSNGNVSAWFMDSAAVSGSAGFGVGLSWAIAGVGDINGDLRDDIVWRNANGDLILWFMDGGSVTGASLGNVSTAWQIECLGDFNGDGRDDFIWRNGVTNDMSMWLMDGTTAIAGTFANVGAPWNIAGIGDFNGDGRDDVIWRNSATGDVSMWFMNGSTIAANSGFGIAASWTIAAVGDFNGDGKDDLVWRNTATGDTIAWYMNGATVVGSALLGTLAAEWIVS